jgi:hypothetical protein
MRGRLAAALNGGQRPGLGACPLVELLPPDLREPVPGGKVDAMPDAIQPPKRSAEAGRQAFEWHLLEGARFMIWREEQRAMGEIARDRDRDSVVGFATFATRATGPDARWFTNFVTDLTAGGSLERERLKLIQGLLARLVRLLDPG